MCKEDQRLIEYRTFPRLFGNNIETVFLPGENWKLAIDRLNFCRGVIESCMEKKSVINFRGKIS